MSRRRGRFALRLSVLAGLVALAAVPSVASAGGPRQSDPNPLSTNVPYLAWRGEHVRLVKCTGDLPQSDIDAITAADTRSGPGIWFPDVKADVLVEDWSGLSDFQPQVAPGTVDLYLSNDGLCVKADVISQKAGLAMLKLVVTLDQSSPLYDVLFPSEILGVHQFLAGWMNLESPSLTELPVGGDAATLNSFTASDDPTHDGVLRAQVTGNMPLGNNFSELGLGPSIQMPSGWPALAGALASDRNPDNSAPWFRWDIHDDTTLAEGHTAGSGCTTGVTLTAGDAVDNCNGDSRYSRFFDADGPAGPLTPISLGLSKAPTIGPFDPQRPDETLLPDGALTADDAPMPAARIDVSIAPNSGAATDISGIGSLHRNDKAKFFSRDRVATANAGSGATTPHNLYAPFYSAYIPATANSGYDLFGDPVSGTDGPPQGNNFPGFLVGDGIGGEGDWADTDNKYNYWDIAHVFSKATGGNTTCLRRIDYNKPDFRQLPYGAQSVAVYTDEHGMAQVNYRPGTGAFYDNLATTRNANGGCDLNGIDVLGTSTISASAKYPYQPTTDIAPKVSAPITKTVHSLFAKFLTAFPKGAGTDNANARIVVAHAQDVDGSGFGGETVCFVNTSSHGAVQPYVYNGVNQRVFGVAPGATFDVAGSSIAREQRPDSVCMKTNAAGNAAVEVFESEGGTVDIVAFFVNEGLLRDLLVNFAAPAPPGGTPTPPPVTTSSGTPAPAGATGQPAENANGNSTPTASATTKALTTLGVKKAVKKASKAKVRFVRLVTSASGKRALVVRLSGHGKARIRIRLYDASGKAVTRATRTVPRGRTVKVKNLRVTLAHVRATVKVIG
jgi:hypothetical protein